VRPKCNTCQSKNLTCVYDVAEDGKTTTQLRAHVRRLAKELEDMKSVVPLLAMTPDRALAANWAAEIEKNGFAHHSAEDVRKALSGGIARDPHEPLLGTSHESLAGPTPALPDGDSFGTPGSEAFAAASHHMGTSPYGGSSREERYLITHARAEPNADVACSRAQSHTSLVFSHDATPVDATVAMNTSPLSLEAATSALNKFSFDCAFYRRTKRDLLANGWSEVQIFGRCEIDVDTLLLGFMDTQDAQPVSTWCARACNRILPTASLPVRLAVTWLLTKLMRVSAAIAIRVKCRV
jgi:hypothetical protein